MRRRFNAWGGGGLPLLYDMEMHARFPVARPLLIGAELLAHQRLRLGVGQFVEGGTSSAKRCSRGFQAVLHQRTIVHPARPELFSLPILQADFVQVDKNKIHVAVVDDDESFGRAIGRLLRAAGLDPVGYPSAEAFLEDATHTPPDCLVLDIHLGGASGLDLRRHLTAIGRPTPVIFVTAHDEPKIREEALQVGCSAYLRKPVSGQLLLEAIRKAVNPGNH